jgi:CDP-paratose 2-epimerase
MSRRILITGGAGFVGSSLAIRFAGEDPTAEVIALDNLKRRGSELAVERLAAAGVRFVHGDVRSRSDLESSGPVDVILDCSAEPSVQAGYDGDSRYLVDTNLGGTIHCLEYARHHGAGLLFLSTSRVYPIAPMRALPLEPVGDRLAIPAGHSGVGWSERGLSAEFPLEGVRTLYGATKLCSELLVHEYGAMYGLPTIVDRCGVVAGPWQMGKVDQGFFTLWAARHLYGGSLAYQGFGGEGLQVRDVLHVDDLFDLVTLQVQRMKDWSGSTFQVGGGLDKSVSLRELTTLCEARSGRHLEFGSRPETHPSDVPWYVSDASVVSDVTGWSPRRTIPELLDDVCAWLEAHRSRLEPLLGGAASEEKAE